MMRFLIFLREKMTEQSICKLLLILMPYEKKAFVKAVAPCVILAVGIVEEVKNTLLTLNGKKIRN